MFFMNDKYRVKEVNTPIPIEPTNWHVRIADLAFSDRIFLHPAPLPEMDDLSSHSNQAHY